MRTASLVTNIIALVLMFPSVICSTLCGAATGAAMSMSGSAASGDYVEILAKSMWYSFLFGIIGSIMGFISISKPKTTMAYIAGALMIASGLGNLFQIIASNIIGLIVGIMYIVSGILLILNTDSGKPA
jgi:hypothetical protein